MRELKGKVIEEVEHPITKRVGKIRLDKRSMTFFAREVDTDWDREPFASLNGHEVKQWLLAQLKHSTDEQNMDWIPVIEVETGGSSKHYYRDDSKEAHRESIDLDLKRYYIGLTRDKREWRVLQWEQVDPESSTFVPENERYAVSKRFALGPKAPDINSWNRPFKLPEYESRGDDSEVKLAYTPELWEGLLTIVRALKAARKQIRELVGTKKGNEAVVAIGQGTTPLLLKSGE